MMIVMIVGTQKKNLLYVGRNVKKSNLVRKTQL